MAVNIGPKIGIDGEAEYRKQISGIIQETKTLKSEYEALSAQFDKGKQSLSQNREMHRILGEEITAQKDRVEKLKDMVQKSAEKFGEADPKTQKWKEALNNANTELAEMEKELKDLPSDIQLVGNRFEDVGNKIKSVGNKIESIGSSITRMTAPLTAAIGLSAKNFADVDKTMQLTKQTMGATEEEAKQLQDAMEKAAASSIFSMNDAATASLNFARAGLDAEQAANALAPAMNLAAGAGGDLETVSQGLVGTINAFGDGFENTERYANVFARACNNSALDVNTLSEAMGVAAPIFNTAGWAIKDLTLYMGLMANKNIDASTAANSLKTGLARLVKPAKEGATALSRLGITGEDALGNYTNALINADGSMKESTEVLSILHNAFETLSESEKMAAASSIFGKNQMAYWLALIDTAPSEVESLSAALEDESVTVQNSAEAMMSGFGGSLEKLKSSIDVASTTFGEALAPSLQKIADDIQMVVDWFNSLSDAEREQIAQATLAVTAIGPVLLGIAKVVSLVGSAIASVKTVIGVVSSIAAGSAAAIVAAIGGIALAVGSVVDMIVNGWSVISTILEAIGLALAAVGVVALGAEIAIAAAVAATVFAITQAIILIKDHWTEITAFFKGIVDSWAAWWKAFCQAMGVAWQNTCNTVRNLWNGATNALFGFFNSLQSRFSTMVNNLQGTFTNFVSRATRWGRDLMDNFIDGIRSMWNNLIDTVSDIADTIADYLGFSEPDKGPLSNFHTYAPDMMELFAKGIKDSEGVVQRQIESSFDFSGLTTEAFMAQATPYVYMPDTATSNSVSIGSTQIIINATEGQSVYEIADAVDEIINQRYQRAQATWA